MALLHPGGSGPHSHAAPDGTTVQIQLPGQAGATIGGFYGFTVGHATIQTIRSARPYPGRQRQAERQCRHHFLYRLRLHVRRSRGFIGYRTNGKVDPAYPSSNPILSPVGDVALPTAFVTDYLTDLAGNTSLLPTDTATFKSVISGIGRLTIGSGTVVFEAANTYSGGTSIASGATLKLGTGGSLLASGALAVDGTFDLANNSQTVGALRAAVRSCSAAPR